MKAVVYPEPNKFEIREVPRPVPGPGQALVKIKSTTICGTDLRVLGGQWPATKFPHIPGHEWSGEVVAVAQDVTEIVIGDRVAAEPHVGCGRCVPCMNGLYNLCEHYGDVSKGHAHIGFTVPGGLAEYCAVSVKALHRLSDKLSYDQAAFCESVGVALYAVERVGVEPGDSAVVVGPGAVGLLAGQIARACGATNVVMVGFKDEPRLSLAKEFGVNSTVDLAELQEDAVPYVKGLVGGQGADVVIEFAGTASAAQMSLLVARRGGRVALCGSTSPGKILEIDCSVITRGHLNVFGSLANPKWICRRGLDMIAAGHVNVNPLITHHYALEQFGEALEVFKSKTAGAYRVMLHPND